MPSFSIDSPIFRYPGAFSFTRFANPLPCIMKITRYLPQFKRSTMLIVVMSKTIGIIYEAARGSIQKRSEVKEPMPRYSDREGFIMSGGRSGTFQGGRPVESKNDDIVAREVESKIRRELDTIVKTEDVEGIYLFDEQHKLRHTLSTLPASIRGKITGVKGANYTKKHPFEILFAIQEGMASPGEVMA